MPFQSEAQRRFMHSQHPDIAERWEKHTTKKQRRALPRKVGKAMDETLDAFGVSRPDLAVAKAKLGGKTATRQRRVVGAVSATPGVGAVGGGIAAGHYAPSGHKASSGLRAGGRSFLEGSLGTAAGQAAGLGASALTRGRLHPNVAASIGAVPGGMAGAAHGGAASMRTTQRRYGVRKPG